MRILKREGKYLKYAEISSQHTNKTRKLYVMVKRARLGYEAKLGRGKYKDGKIIKVEGLE